MAPGNVGQLSRRWSYATGESYYRSGPFAPVFTDGLALVTSGRRGVAAVDVRTGAERWRQEIGAPSRSAVPAA